MSERQSSFDVIVIGAGQAGPPLAAKLATAGRRVALLESRELGGTCVNWGCTPTKTLRKSARVAYMVQQAPRFGVHAGEVRVDFAAAMRRMQDRVEQSRAGLKRWLDGIEGLKVMEGRGRLAGCSGKAYVVMVDGRRLTAPRILLNTGTRPRIPDIPGLAAVDYLDNETLLALRDRPEHLLIIGGSYIGLEMAQIFRRLGSSVSVIDGGERLASREDKDISEALASLMKAEGISVHLGCEIEGAEAHAGGVQLRLAGGAAPQGSHLLVATGRTPNTDALGLETLDTKIEMDDHGYITTNAQLETSAPGIWALGDINGRGAFTHTSYHDHDIVAENILGNPDAPRSAEARHAIYAMFTDPPLGHVGLYEADARQLVRQGRSISLAVIEMEEVSRAKEEGETFGRLKLLIDEQSGKFLGATMLGIGADEIIQVIGQAMSAGTHWRIVRNALPVHPTVTEFLPTLIDKRKPLSGD
ncbi:mercuric reductase [Ramlibacter sp. AN1015]|uniref:mercuric reductase n=1 Tax=Ramlibacter sp. AN1015 TaxID=3133428 RepID=UPI0030C421AA